MELTMTDVAVFVYTLGVIFSGIWLSNQLGPGIDLVTIAPAALIAVAWTAYFNYKVVPQFSTDESADADAPTESTK